MPSTTDLPPRPEEAAATGEAPLATHRRLAANIGSNYVALFAQVAFLLLMTPYVIDRLGTRAFGGWAIVLSVAGYLRLLDLGMSPATARFVAAAKTPAALSRVVDTTLTILTAVGVVALGVGLGVAFVSPSIFPHVLGLRSALVVAGISTAVQIPLAAFGGVLFGAQRIAERNVATLVRIVGSAVAIVIAVEAGGHLFALVAAVAIVEVAVAIGQGLYCLRALPELRLGFPVVDRPLLRELGSFSFAILGLAVATQVAFYSDGIVIGVALTATAVAVYSVAMRVVDGTSQLLGQFADVFMPIFSRAEATDRRARAREILDVGTRVTLTVGYPLIALLIGLGQALLVGWLGDDFAASWGPLALLAGALAFGAPLRFGILWAIAAARHGRIAVYAVLDSLLNLGLSIALVGPLGINGVALATLLSVAVSNGWLMPRVIYAAVEMSLWQTYFRPMLRAAAVVTPFVLLMRFIVSPLVDDSLGLAILASLVWLVLGVPLTGAVVFTGTERRTARARLRQRVAHRFSS